MEKQLYAIPLIKVPVALDTLYSYSNSKALRIKAPNREKAIAIAWQYCAYHTKNSSTKVHNGGGSRCIYVVISPMVKYTVSFTHPDVEVLNSTSKDFLTQLVRDRYFRSRRHREPVFPWCTETIDGTPKDMFEFYSDSKFRSEIERWLSVAQKCNDVLDYCVQTKTIDDVCEIASILGRNFY